MARMCIVTGKKTAKGNHVAHCNKKVKRTFKPNLVWKRFWIPSQKRFERLLVSQRGMRIIDKLGIEVVFPHLLRHPQNTQ